MTIPHTRCACLLFTVAIQQRQRARTRGPVTELAFQVLQLQAAALCPEVVFSCSCKLLSCSLKSTYRLARALSQVNLPIARVEGCPVGLGLIGPPGSDEALLELTERLMALLQP